ncbi:sialic acid TRAP transporter substrate-binding protein SiaP [Arenibaculum sp.]|jgi:tripartite ATP-independent transporter DctP family solute receptor|uniref:sialic acid TRAP transporter substrate-binding protein SiaP n=1 Tax=Arenibaculum sp. TaxID=2865862 RepID=UPI002E160CC7|nr:sialic acid TRAP transporter substrate-binding protein SiaP [Arenibaculum sp.]
MKKLLLGALAIAALAVPQFARAAETLQFAHVYETSEPYHKWALWAADEIAKRTDGRYEVKVFPASSLGKETDINQGLTLGTVDIIYTGTNFAARSYPPLALGTAPYMFRDRAHWEAYAGSDLFQELASGYEEATGNEIVALLYYGERHVTSKTPIDTPEQMKGMKIRVPDAPMYVMFPNAVGANPTPIAFAEVYLALQQGTVDAQENPLPTILAKKFHEPTPVINLTGHVTESLLTVIGAPTWNQLSEEDRKIFTEVLQEAAAKSNADIVAAEEELVTGFEKMGATVNKVDRAPFREMVMKVHLGPDVPWSKDQYDRLQALQ